MNENKKALIAFGSSSLLIIALVVVVACVPKDPISPQDIEIIEELSIDALDLVGFVETLRSENRGPTLEEMDNIRKLTREDIESFKAVMERIKASEGESLAYKLLEKILLGLM